MSKKHFEALAAALKSSHPSPAFKVEAAYAAQVSTWRISVDAVTDVCARFNPNFDRARFLAACGVEG